MILITGGTGLLGTHLINHLYDNGIRPRAIYRNHIPDIVKHKADWVKGDVIDIGSLEDALKGVKQVYHVAGYVSFNPKHRAAMHKINVEGTANVVNVSLDAGIDKLIHVSSVAALGRIRQGNVIDERMQWTEETSNSEYGKTKYLGEMEVWRGIGEGLNAAIVNPVIVMGEYGDWTKGSMNIFRNIKNGFNWYTKGSSGFVDADDVARAMVLLMQSDISAQRFIISNQNITYQDYFNMIADAFIVKRPAREVSPFLAEIIWRAEKLKSMITGADPLITRESAKTGLAHVSYDNTKLLKAMPQFTYTPLQDSVVRICKYLSG